MRMSISPGTLGGEEGVGDVDGVVDAGADADDVANSQVGIDGHPQSGMAEPHHVHQGEQDAAEDEETGRIGGNSMQNVFLQFSTFEEPAEF